MSTTFQVEGIFFLSENIFLFHTLQFFVRSQVFVGQALPKQFRVHSALHVELGKQGQQIAVLQCECVHGSKSEKQGHGCSFNIKFHLLGLIRRVKRP